MSDQSNTTPESVEDEVRAEVAATAEKTKPEPETPETEGDTPTGDDVEVQEPEEEAVKEAPYYMKLLEHHNDLLGKDKISAKQMRSFLAFLTNGDENANPLQHPFVTDELGRYGRETLAIIARDGRHKAIPNREEANALDEKYLEHWNAWRDAGQPGFEEKLSSNYGGAWLKGIVCTVLLISEDLGVEEGGVSERYPRQAELERIKSERAAAEAKARREAQEKAEAEAAAKKAAEEEAKEPESETPEEEQGEE